MRNLVFFADGTWNNSDNPARLTNVCLLSNMCPKEGERDSEQLATYQEGVGTTGLVVSRITGGAFANGLDDNIIEAYCWLATNYRPSDRIFLFGFSRGAYTVRSLVGMINRAGFLDLSSDDFDNDKKKALAKIAFSKYRDRGRDDARLKGVPRHPRPNIHFLGCWDTVGALGVPDDVTVIRRLFRPGKYTFNDTTLSDNVLIARHAVAIDEQRRAYAPTLWDEPDDAEERDLKQVWFSGVHSNVGGGYETRDLSDITLKWMIDEATSAGLILSSAHDVVVNPIALGKLEDSRSGFFGKLKSRPRSVPSFRGADGARRFSAEALTRQSSDTGYWVTNTLSPGESISLEISSKEHWNSTKLFLEKGGRYRFSANGQWSDAKVDCGPGGVAESERQLGHKVGDLWSRFERRAGGNAPEPSTYSPARRYLEADWFALVGVIANGAGVDQAKNEINEHETFLIGDGMEMDVKKAGYLYCYANDAWKFYFNNSGSITLTVERIS